MTFPSLKTEPARASNVRERSTKRHRLSHEQRLLIRKVLAHAFLLSFLAIVLVPFVMVVSASFRQGNFAPSRLLPDKISLDHWKYVLGIPYTEVVNPATGETRVVKPVVPPLLWFWNSIKVSCLSSAGIILLSGTAAYAFPDSSSSFAPRF